MTLLSPEEKAQRKQTHRANRKARWVEYRRKNPKHYLLRRARERAKRKGLEFTITISDFEIPKRCPALGILLEWENPDSSIAGNLPTLDRIVNEKGYIPGNVVVVSMRANTAKGSLSIKELVKLARFYEQKSRESTSTKNKKKTSARI